MKIPVSKATQRVIARNVHRSRLEERTPCECGRPTGQCVKGDMDRCPTDDDDGGACSVCGGSGFVDECECQQIEDVCCCLHPRPMTCTECNGNG